MKTITSTQNPEIISTAALADGKERQRQNKFIAEGVRTCSALLASSLKLHKLYIQADRVQQLLPQLQSNINNDKIILVTENVMNKISQSSSPSGIVAVFELPKKAQPSDLQPGLVLARISDPGNMGTLIRTCAALNKKSVVVIEGCDPWSPKVVQSSAGTIGLINVIQLSWDELIKHKGAHRLCALVVSGGKNIDRSYHDALLVVGNEAHGIPAAWLAACQEQLTLAMPGNAESLNAAVAGSLALYLTVCGE